MGGCKKEIEDACKTTLTPAEKTKAEACLKSTGDYRKTNILKKNIYFLHSVLLSIHIIQCVTEKKCFFSKSIITHTSPPSSQRNAIVYSLLWAGHIQNYPKKAQCWGGKGGEILKILGKK